MTGGKLQLEVYGEQNKYFTDNPDITYFKILYKRYTNFAMETIKQDTDDDLGLGKLVEYTIGRAGDLLTNLYLEIDLNLTFNNSLNSSTDTLINFGHNIIDYIELVIGDNVIDRHSGKWLQIYNDIIDKNDVACNGYVGKKGNSILTTEYNYLSSFYTKYKQMTGNGVHDIFNNNSNNFKNMNSKYYGGGNTFFIEDTTSTTLKGRLIIPLQFWFCKNPGLALPLISLQYHEVKVRIKFNTISKTKSLIKTTEFTDSGGDSITTDNEAYFSPNIKGISDTSHYINNLGFNTLNLISSVTDNSTYTLWGDYIFLDKEERNNFSIKSHEYLIEQTQHYDTILNNSTFYLNNQKVKLDFKYPLKELIWTFQREDYLFETDFLNLVDYEGTIKIIMNGQERIKNQNVLFFTKYNLEKYHSGSGGIPNTIFIYSFSLDPEIYQPMGFCNISAINELSLHIDNLKLFISKNWNFEHTDGDDTTTYSIYNENTNENVKIDVYAINYNILRITSGMGSIVYSN